MVSEIWTIGHSTRPIEEFTALLSAHRIDFLADVRKIPRSARHPQFEQGRLRASLRESGVEYAHFAGLGGLRKARPDSTNDGLRNLSFRGYADYMETGEFESALGALLERAEGRRAAVMCAEAVPWRCHRSMVADALAARGVTVRHILTAGEAKEHALSKGAVAHAGRVSYPKKAEVR